MKKNLSIFSFACLTMAVFTSAACGQGFQSGYQFGAGLGAVGFVDPFFGAGGNFRSFSREQLPYFAQFPPVYYSHIVRRPYGISPFAAPPGILPAEMMVPTVPVNPKQILNPHFQGQQPIKRGMLGQEIEELPSQVVPDAVPLEPADDQPSQTDATTSVQWQTNPYFSRVLLSVRE